MYEPDNKTHICVNCKKPLKEHYDHACTWSEYDENEDI